MTGSLGHIFKIGMSHWQLVCRAARVRQPDQPKQKPVKLYVLSGPNLGHSTKLGPRPPRHSCATVCRIRFPAQPGSGRDSSLISSLPNNFLFLLSSCSLIGGVQCSQSALSQTRSEDCTTWASTLHSKAVLA